jgi:hypothetical protein
MANKNMSASTEERYFLCRCVFLLKIINNQAMFMIDESVAYILLHSIYA